MTHIQKVEQNIKMQLKELSQSKHSWKDQHGNKELEVCQHLEKLYCYLLSICMSSCE